MVPYINPTILTSFTSGVDWSTIPTPDATADQNYAEQVNICRRATDWVDATCGQVLRATIDTEEEEGPHSRLVVRNNGTARMQLSRFPVLQLLSGQVALATSFPLTYNTVPQNMMATENGLLTELGTVAPDGAGIGPSAVIVAPGYVTWWNGRQGYRLRITYVNGWPHCGVVGAVSAGDVQLTVDDITGWTGVTGTLYDGGATESFQVASVTPSISGATSGPGTLAFPAGQTALFNHNASAKTPLLFSALPGNVQLAALYHAVSQVLERGIEAITVPDLAGNIGSTVTAKDGGDLITEGEILLHPFSRII